MSLFSDVGIVFLIYLLYRVMKYFVKSMYRSLNPPPRLPWPEGDGEDDILYVEIYESEE